MSEHSAVYSKVRCLLLSEHVVIGEAKWDVSNARQRECATAPIIYRIIHGADFIMIIATLENLLARKMEP
jgi:hypothetical protein